MLKCNHIYEIIFSHNLYTTYLNIYVTNKYVVVNNFRDILGYNYFQNLKPKCYISTIDRFLHVGGFRI